MDIRIITDDKKALLPLLLLADEQESMIDRYLDRGTLYALYDVDEPICVCVVTDEDDGVCEIKNIATLPAYQRLGYARQLIEYACAQWRARGFHTVRVGTGDSPLILPFYHRLGFREAYRIPHFFTLNYDHPMVEDGVLLDDMVVLERGL